MAKNNLDLLIFESKMKGQAKYFKQYHAFLVIVKVVVFSDGILIKVRNKWRESHGKITPPHLGAELQLPC